MNRAAKQMLFSGTSLVANTSPGKLSFEGVTVRKSHGSKNTTVLGPCFASETLLEHSEMNELHLNISHQAYKCNIVYYPTIILNGKCFLHL